MDKVQCLGSVTFVLLKELLCSFLASDLFKTSSVKGTSQFIGAPERCLQGIFGVRGAGVGLLSGPCYIHSSKYLLLPVFYEVGSCWEHLLFQHHLSFGKYPSFLQKSTALCPYVLGDVDSFTRCRNRRVQDSGLTNQSL